jgi:surfactin family lipopeptide synthetase C
VWQGLDEPLQFVKRSIELPWQTLDWRGLSDDALEQKFAKYLQAERADGMDLTQAPLLRFALIQLCEDAWQFVWSRHHLLLDGWSVSILLKEVFVLYEAYRKGQLPSLTRVRSYAHYINWLRQRPQAEAEIFWRRLLAGFTEPVTLQVSKKTIGAAQAQAARERVWVLSPARTARLQSFARRHELTLNTLLQAAWALLLSHYGDTKDIVYGVAVSGRPATLTGAETVVGMFINTLPVRIKIEPQTLVLPWLKQIQTQQIEINQFQHTPLVDVLGWSELPRTQALFDTLLAFENYPVNNLSGSDETRLVVDNVRTLLRTNYPITVLAFPGEKLSLQIAYDEQFDTETISQMGEHLLVLLESLITEPGQRLNDVTPINAADRQR